MNNSLHLSYVLIIGVLVAICVILFNREQKVEVVEKCVTDTLFITRIDTIVHTNVKYQKEVVIDTIYVSDAKEVFLPITQKHYSSSESYDVWVSGYKPNLDSIVTYPKTIYQTITNETIREIEINRLNLYAYLGFKRFSNEYIPSIGLMVKGRKNGLYGIEIGVNGGNDIFWGINVGYKLK